MSLLQGNQIAQMGASSGSGIVWNGTTWAPGAVGGTLDAGYDFGGSGAGRTITADGGAVRINKTSNDANNGLEVDVSSGTGAALTITSAYTATSGTVKATTIASTFSGSGATTVAQALVITPTVNFTGGSTGHYEALNISVTETALPTGPNYLLRLRAGVSGATDMLAVDNAGRLLQGTTSPWSSSTALLGNFYSNQAGASLSLQEASATAAPGPIIGTVRSRGSDTSPTNVLLGDQLGGFWFGGRTDSAWLFPTRIDAYAIEDWTGKAGSDLRFSTTAAGATTSTEQWRLTSAGSWLGNSGVVLGWTSGTAGATADTGMARNGATITAHTGGSGTVPNGFSAASGFSVGNGTAVATAGTVAWVTGLGAKSGTAPHVIGPIDQDFYLSGGQPTGSAVGKSVFLTAGSGGTTLGTGGVMTVQGGPGHGSVGPGGDLFLYGGDASGTTNNGGAAWLRGGAGGSTGSSGNVFIQTASGTFVGSISINAGQPSNSGTSGGVVNIAGGTGSDTGTSTGGAVSLLGGSGGASGGTGGPINITGGNASIDNTSAGNVVVSTGAPTGTGSADLLLRTGFLIASGGVSQLIYDRYRPTGKTKALTNNTATTFCNISAPTNDTTSVVSIFYMVRVIDAGGAEQSSAGWITFAIVNKAGTVTATTGTAFGTAAQLVTGTDAISFGTSVASTTVSLQATSNTSLTATTHDITYQVFVNGQANSSPQ